MPELVARRFVVDLWEIQQHRDAAPLSRLFLLLEILEFGIGDQTEVAEPVERGQATDPKVLSEFGDFVELDIATLRRRPGSNLDDLALIEDIRPKAARPDLADRSHETPDAFLRQEQARGKGVRAHLNEVVAVSRPADRTETAAVQKHVGVLVGVREPAPEKMMAPIGNDEEADGRVTQGEPRHVIGQVYESRPDGLGLQDLRHVRDRGEAQLQPHPLVVGDLLALLDGLPSTAGSRYGVNGDGAEVSVDAEKTFEVHHLAAERDAGPQGIDHLLVLYDVWVRSEEGNEGIVLTKLLGKEFPELASVKAREPIELEAGHRPVPKLHLSHGGTRDSKAAGNGLLRHPAGLARHPESPPELLLANRHDCFLLEVLALRETPDDMLGIPTQLVNKCDTALRQASTPAGIAGTGTLSVEDPANPSGNDLSGLLNDAVRSELATVARRTLNVIDDSGWEAVFGPVEEKSDRDKREGLRRAAAAVVTPTKPWSRGA